MQSDIKKSLSGASYKVIGSKGFDVWVEFVSSGYRCRVKRHLEAVGNVYDPTDRLKESLQWEDVSIEYENNSGLKFNAFKKKGGKLKVIFTETGYVTEVYQENAKAGKVKDVYAISCYDVGYLGLINKSITYHKQAKQLWQNMLKRCYSIVDDRGYGKAFVDERWFSFENFLTDIKNLDGFDGWLEGNNGGHLKFNLDKDFYKKDNITYSRHLCCFLPESFNKSLGKKGKVESDWA